jgi:hypothetical protein
MIARVLIGMRKCGQVARDIRSHSRTCTGGYYRNDRRIVMTHAKTSSRFVLIATLSATGMALLSAAVFAQNRPQVQPAGAGSGQQTQQMQQSQQMQQQQKRQVERAMNQGQTMDHDRLQTRERTQAQAAPSSAKAAGNGIYGGNLMTLEERNQYREQLGKLQTDQERNEFKARHSEQMNLRARERGVEAVVTAD